MENNKTKPVFIVCFTHFLENVKLMKKRRTKVVIPKTTNPVNKLVKYKKAINQAITASQTNFRGLFFSWRKK